MATLAPAEAPVRAYAALREQVKDTLLTGQREIERAKVHTYWKAGKLINAHVERAKSADEHYGGKVMARLSEDLDIGVRVLERCAQFARLIDISSARTKSSGLTWAHYRELITVKDERSRQDLMKRAQASGWTQRELRGKIQAELRSDEPGALNANGGSSLPRLIPRRGELYAYRVTELKALNGEDSTMLCLDMGFAVRRELPAPLRGEGRVRVGDILETVKENNDYSTRLSQRAEKDLFTYSANIERIVDGDTLIVNIDLGFKSWVRQYLRLRGLDCPELDTPEGKKARAFVERELSRSGRIILTSSRSDKYDRYLADVFYTKDGQDIYLNQLLVDEGLAGRV